MKALSKTTVADFMQFPVWEFVDESDDSEEDDLFLAPVDILPVTDLSNRIVGTKVTLQNGESRWAMLGNICLSNKRSTEQFLTLSVECDGKWFDLARYHDVDFADRGPAQLAEFLGRSIDEIFPIKYDISSLAIGFEEVTSGELFTEPKEKLSASELIDLTLE